MDTKTPITDAIERDARENDSPCEYTAAYLRDACRKLETDRAALIAALEYLEEILADQSEETFELELNRIRAALARVQS